MAMDIIDTPFNTTAKISCLVSHGVGTVIRYYNFSNSLSFPEKCLQLAEAQALGAHGVQIAVVFQQRQNQVADFTEVKGTAAGRRAYRHAHDNIGQPAGSAIYFAVDFDASPDEIEKAIRPFFKGIKRAFDEESAGATQYRLGVYGSGLVCRMLSDKGLIDFIWLAMSRGFSGTREALAAREFHLAQRAPAATLCGLDVDFNDANPAHTDLGTFTVSDDTPEHRSIGPVGRSARARVGESDKHRR